MSVKYQHEVTTAVIIRKIAFIIVAIIAAIIITLPAGCTSSISQPSVARDLTGTWTGNGVYYQLDLYGNRVLKVTCDVVMSLKNKFYDIMIRQEKLEKCD